jgi:hypothetical protein
MSLLLQSIVIESHNCRSDPILMNFKTIAILMFFFLQNCSAYEYRNYSYSDGVLLAVSRVDSGRIRLKLRNESTDPIFLGHRFLDEQVDLADVRYRLVCYEGDIEKDFGPEYHSGEGLDPLNAGAEVEFEVFPIPKFRRNCYVSVGYYKDAKAVEIVERVVATSAPRFTAEEEVFLEQARQKAVVTVNLNSVRGY